MAKQLTRKQKDDRNAARRAARAAKKLQFSTPEELAAIAAADGEPIPETHGEQPEDADAKAARGETVNPAEELGLTITPGQQHAVDQAVAKAEDPGEDGKQIMEEDAAEDKARQDTLDILAGRVTEAEKVFEDAKASFDAARAARGTARAELRTFSRVPGSRTHPKGTPAQRRHGQRSWAAPGVFPDLPNGGCLWVLYKSPAALAAKAAKGGQVDTAPWGRPGRGLTRSLA